jgi:hypothetical protein
MDKETTDAVLQLIAERRVKRKKKAKKKKATQTAVPQTATLSIPMNVSGNESKVRTVVFNRDRTLSIKEQLKDDPEIGDLLKRLTGKSGKTMKNRPTDALKELTNRADKGSLSLIYALQKDVRDLAKKITQPIQQSVVPYGQRGTDRFDIGAGVQRAIAEEKKKLKIGTQSVPLAELGIVEIDDGLGNTRKVKETKSNIQPKKKRLVISPFIPSQGIREVAVGMMNPPDIGAGGGMDNLLIPEDYLNTPTWRSTIDVFERPKLREVLAEPPSEIPYYQDETIAEIPLEGEIDGGTIAELPDEGQDSQDFGDGGGDEPASPAKKKVVVSGEPLVVSGKKKGRPAGSKNKPKPETDPNKIAIIGSSALKGGGASGGKTPANSPLL